MKLIRYNGGIVSFKLPDDWKEEYYDEGGAAFYRDTDDSGTLRVSVISFEMKSNEDESITLASESGVYVQEGFPLKEEVKFTSEDGENLLIYFWEIHIPVEGKRRRIILFSYTILASQENNPVIIQELSFVKNTIIAAHYSLEKGI